MYYVYSLLYFSLLYIYLCIVRVRQARAGRACIGNGTATTADSVDLDTHFNVVYVLYSTSLYFTVYVCVLFLLDKLRGELASAMGLLRLPKVRLNLDLYTHIDVY